MMFQRRETSFYIYIYIYSIDKIRKRINRNLWQINFSSLGGGNSLLIAYPRRIFTGYRYFDNTLSLSVLWVPEFNCLFLSLIVVSQWRPLESALKSTRNACSSSKGIPTWHKLVFRLIVLLVVFPSLHKQLFRQTWGGAFYLCNLSFPLSSHTAFHLIPSCKCNRELFLSFLSVFTHFTYFTFIRKRFEHPRETRFIYIYIYIYIYTYIYKKCKHRDGVSRTVSNVVEK